MVANLPPVFFDNAIHNPSVEIAETEISDEANSPEPRSKSENSNPNQEGISTPHRSPPLKPPRMANGVNGLSISTNVLTNGANELNSPLNRSRSLMHSSSFSVDMENMQLHMESDPETNRAPRTFCAPTSDVVGSIGLAILTAFLIAIGLKICIEKLI
ncbi:hypothetical protein Ddc_15286 [Ditylenchus destructor]|nr:hypothetical protein Ddc_15286 [Ditylenchus destructor]